jgi:hypothetical protein
MPVIGTLGYRKKKNWLTPGMTIAQAKPKTHVRSVVVGID